VKQILEEEANAVSTVIGQ